MTNTEIKGILGAKLGMTQVFDENNRVVPVTVVKAGPCVVTGIRTEETDGYNAVQIAFGAIDPRKVTKPVAGQFDKAGVTPRRHVAEIRLENAEQAAGFEIGQELGADVFEDGAFVDVTGTSKGKGFAGVIKRYGFAGGPGGHGAHFHRAPGSIGQCATPSRVFKGVRLPGHMGCDTVTVKNLKVMRVDEEQNLILVKGAIPGGKDGIVRVRMA